MPKVKSLLLMLMKKSKKLNKTQSGTLSGWVVTMIPCRMITTLLRTQRMESINIIQSRALLGLLMITWIKPPFVVLIKIKVITDRIFSKISVFDFGKLCSILSIIILSSQTGPKKITVILGEKYYF